MDDKIRVLVAGACGNMGLASIGAIAQHPRLEVVASVDPRWDDLKNLTISDDYFIGTDIERAIDETGPDVLLDFTNAEAAEINATIALGQDIPVVVGTTGYDLPWWNEFYVQWLDHVTSLPALFVAPNFALQTIATVKSAMMFVQTTRCGVEIIERHRRVKADSPSGTAVWAAQQLAPLVPEELRWAPEQDGLGLGYNVDGVRVHAIRGHGYLACLEIICTSLGGTTVFLDEVKDRAAFMPGVTMALEAIVGRTDEFIPGLDKLIPGNNAWDSRALLDMD